MAGMRRATGLVRRIAALQGTNAARAPSQVPNVITPLHTISTRCTIRVPSFLRNAPGGLSPAAKLFQASNYMGIGIRHFSDSSSIPVLSDPKAKEALKVLLATNWSKIEEDVSDAVKAAIAKGGPDVDILSTVWSSAQACEIFADTLIALRMELDQLSGDTGEYVGRIPDSLTQALEAAYKKYIDYLESFGEDEEYLKKKVENDLGSILVQIKQRCNGLDPKWSKITLLGTSGLSGSYIELRNTP
ncbi:unnamed protein product [Calypogeia fissa]